MSEKSGWEREQKEIAGVLYEIQDAWDRDFLSEEEKFGEYWVPVDHSWTAPVVCKCGNREFMVVHRAGAYSTICHCKCGNKFEVHSG